MVTVNLTFIFRFIWYLFDLYILEDHQFATNG